MGHQYHGGLLFAIESQQEIKNVLAIGAIQVSGWFIGHQNRRLGDESASQRDPLLFAAGELDGVMMSALREPDTLQEFFSAALDVAFISA